MSKVILGVVLGAVVIGGGYYVVSHNKLTPESAQVATNDTKETQPTGKKMAFSEFVKQGGSYQCTVHPNGTYVETSGLTYVSDGKVRGEYITTTQDVDITTTFIVRDGYTYNWSSALSNIGFKSKIANNVGTNSPAGTASYIWNPNQVSDYDCQPWIADPSKFVIPTNITFKSVDA